MTPEARFWAVLGLIVAVVGIVVPVLLDKSGVVNFPVINFQPTGSGGDGDGFPTPFPTLFPTPREPVEVPDVTGLPEQDAKDALAKAGLHGFRLPFTKPAESCSYESGEVESTTPPAGFQTRTGAQVGLEVCE